MEEVILENLLKRWLRCPLKGERFVACSFLGLSTLDLSSKTLLINDQWSPILDLWSLIRDPALKGKPSPVEHLFKWILPSGTLLFTLLATMLRSCKSTNEPNREMSKGVFQNCGVGGQAYFFSPPPSLSSIFFILFALAPIFAHWHDRLKRKGLLRRQHYPSPELLLPRPTFFKNSKPEFFNSKNSQ